MTQFSQFFRQISTLFWLQFALKDIYNDPYRCSFIAIASKYSSLTNDTPIMFLIPQIHQKIPKIHKRSNISQIKYKYVIMDYNVKYF